MLGGISIIMVFTGTLESVFTMQNLDGLKINIWAKNFMVILDALMSSLTLHQTLL